jgi:hypothetical protein
MAKQPKANSEPAAGQSQPSASTGGEGEAEKTPTRASLPPYPHPPPQGEGAPRRLFTTRGPATGARLNVAMKVLQDPVARNSFTRRNSGQPRS